MEIDVTHLVRGDLDPAEFACSIHESGDRNIGKKTWAAAVEYAERFPLVQKKDQEELRSWIGEFGAWDDEEIEAMDDVATNALLLQFIAGDIREMEGLGIIDNEGFDDDLELFEKLSQKGEISGRLSPGDDGGWYFYVGI